MFSKSLFLKTRNEKEEHRRQDRLTRTCVSEREKQLLRRTDELSENERSIRGLGERKGEERKKRRMFRRQERKKSERQCSVIY